ncbi:electron transfer flavoprotein subunit beta/FixA family protein [Persicobacter psychrovividus]|uniref:Electron transfer flavoprotein subunit beta n=1 Tax=Persicobacter psychrovividus TaxID=387638 RepID=A0ABN6LBK9_9BACT|nr:electron transfer flavoprotein subunit alpha [Persicobacter psychrovividus]
MKILVCITHVPDTTAKIAFTDSNTKFDESGVQFIIGPYDDYALARAVELKAAHNGTVTVLNVGLANTEPTIRKALAIGADDAIRVNAAPTDSFFVASQIAAVAKDGNYDLILMGRESIDFNSGVVHALVGELLGLVSVSPVMKLEVKDGVAIMDREIEGGKQSVEIPLPFVAGCQEPIAEWKIPNMRGIMTARTKPLQVVEPVGAEEQVKLDQYSLPEAKGAVKIVQQDQIDDLVKMLQNEAKVL